MKCVWCWKGVTEGEESQKVGRASVTMILGAGIIALVLLSLVILYTPRIFGQLPEPGEPFVSETYIENVPFRYQAKNYYCGPASQEMVYAFYGPDIHQYYVAEVDRTDNIFGTGGWDILRASHFSNLSSSIGDDDPWFNCSGYPSRDLGYAAFYWSSPNQNFTEAMNYLYDLIDEGYPIIVALEPDYESYPDFPSGQYDTGHCVVVVGYGSNSYIAFDPVTGGMIFLVNRWVKVHDPWNSIVWRGVGGPNYTIGLEEFNEAWSPYSYSMYFIHPWMVNVTGASVNATSTFVVTANVTYPCPAPFPLGMYPASNCTATIDLSPCFSLSPGENLTKTVGPGGIMTAGSSSTISWNVIAPSKASSYEVGVEAEGRVSEAMWIGPVGMQPAGAPIYNYTDRIGGFGRASVTVQRTRAYSIYLSEGWNLISLPLIPYNSSIEAVLADVLESVEAVWSYEAGIWYSYKPGAPSSLTEILDGKGYWINMSASAVLSVNGTEIFVDPPAPLPSYQLTEGRNLIGMPYIPEDSSIDVVFSGVLDYIETIWSYQEGVWYSYKPGAPSSLTEILAGKGYWIEMSSADVWEIDLG